MYVIWTLDSEDYGHSIRSATHCIAKNLFGLISLFSLTDWFARLIDNQLLSTTTPKSKTTTLTMLSTPFTGPSPKPPKTCRRLRIAYDSVYATTTMESIEWWNLNSRLHSPVNYSHQTHRFVNSVLFSRYVIARICHRWSVVGPRSRQFG